MKLLVINLQNPGDTKYHNPKKIGSWMLGRRLSNFPMFAVDENGKMKQIVFTDSECSSITQQVLEQLQ
jgi:hypothetical protein